MKITYTQDVTNIRFGNKYFTSLLANDAKHKNKLVSRIESAMAFVIGLALTLVLVEYYQLHFLLGAAIAILVAFLLSFILNYVYISRNICKLDVNERLNVYKNIVIDFTDSDVIISVPNVKTIYSFDAIHHYKVFDQYLILAFGKYRGECIPVTAFGSETDKNIFIGMLEKRNIQRK